MSNYIVQRVPKKIQVYMGVTIEVVNILCNIDYSYYILERVLRTVINDTAKIQGTKVQAVRDKLYRVPSCGTDRQAYIAILDMILKNQEEGFSELRKIALTVKGRQAKLDTQAYIEEGIKILRIKIGVSKF